VLVDTCVWIDHDQRGVPRLAELLASDLVVTAGGIVNELRIGCGSAALELSERVATLPWITEPDGRDLMALAVAHDVRCARIGVADARIVLAALLSGASLFTMDRNLEAVARRLGCHFAG
jgi:predicted nucleic acid-binding protein